MAERVIPAAPFTQTTRGVLISPFQFTTTGEDHLRVVSANSAAGVRLRIQGRFFDEKGQLKPFSEAHTPNTDRSVKSTDYALAPGALTNLTVFAEAGAPIVGQTYVMVQLIRGFTGATILLGTLLGGYVTARQPLGWPGSPIIRSTEGEPAVRSVVGTNPAPGNPISETVPTGARWELLSLLFNFTTDATPLQRRVFFVGSVGGAGVYEVMAFNVSGPGEAWIHTFAPDIEGTSDATIGVVQSCTPARAILPAGSILTATASNMQAADDFTAPTFLIREWLEVST